MCHFRNSTYIKIRSTPTHSRYIKLCATPSHEYKKSLQFATIIHATATIGDKDIIYIPPVSWEPTAPSPPFDSGFTIAVASLNNFRINQDTTVPCSLPFFQTDYYPKIIDCSCSYVCVSVCVYVTVTSWNIRCRISISNFFLLWNRRCEYDVKNTVCR